MKMKKFNKATAATLGGAAVTAIGAMFVMDDTLRSALQVIITSALVYFVPNGDD